MVNQPCSHLCYMLKRGDLQPLNADGAICWVWTAMVKFTNIVCFQPWFFSMPLFEIMTLLNFHRALSSSCLPGCILPEILLVFPYTFLNWLVRTTLTLLLICLSVGKLVIQCSWMLITIRTVQLKNYFFSVPSIIWKYRVDYAWGAFHFVGWKYKIIPKEKKGSISCMNTQPQAKYIYIYNILKYISQNYIFS